MPRRSLYLSSTKPPQRLLLLIISVMACSALLRREPPSSLELLPPLATSLTPSCTWSRLPSPHRFPQYPQSASPGLHTRLHHHRTIVQSRLHPPPSPLHHHANLSVALNYGTTPPISLSSHCRIPRTLSSTHRSTNEPLISFARSARAPCRWLSPVVVLPLGREFFPSLPLSIFSSM